MHELSIAQALIEQVTSVAENEQAKVVTRVSVAVGALSGVEPDALTLAFPVAAEGTVAHDAELAIERIPASVACRDCGATDAVDFPFIICTACGSSNVSVAAGRELTLTAVELNG